MGSEAVSDLLFGTFLAVMVLILLLIVWSGARKRLFPSKKEEARSDAMAELLLLQAELQSRASESSGQEGEEGGEDSGDPGRERGWDSGTGP